MKERDVRMALSEVLAAAVRLVGHPPTLETAPIDFQVKIPHSDYPGVYAILDDDDRVLYVGKSEVAVGTRFWTHVRESPEEGGVTWSFDAPGVGQPRKVTVFKLQERDRWLAPALELALIEFLDPPVNVVGRRAQS